MAEKFLLLSDTGAGYGLALRLKQQGHKVAVWARNDRAKMNYNGLLEQLDSAKDWERYLDPKTVVLFDSTGGGKTADRLKARGQAVWAGSAFADQLELDRGTAFELLDQAGVKVPETKTFYDWEEGRRYAKSSNDRLVFKASGRLAKQNEIDSYVSSDGDDLVQMLDYFESIAKASPEFELQQYVKGLAVSTEGWFNGQEFMRPFNHTIEHKPIMNDDIGPSSGCSFNVVWACQENRLVKEGILLVEPLLREYGHVGPVDLNTIVNNEGVWALEFTPRMGYDAFPTIMELIKGDLGELIAKMAKGEEPTELELDEGFAAGLRLSVPPHPSEEFKPQAGVPIRGFERSDRPHCYFFDIMLDEANQLKTTGGFGIVACLTGHGQTISEAFEVPYEIAKRAKVPEKQYRTDAVNVLNIDYQCLQQFLALEHNVMHFVGGVSG